MSKERDRDERNEEPKKKRGDPEGAETREGEQAENENETAENPPNPGATTQGPV